MAIEKINFSYPRGSIQSVFDGEALTALELAATTSKKVDECIDLVNGVQQIAIEASAVVDEMKLAQEQFIIENNDIRSQMLEVQEQLEATITTEVNDFTTQATTVLNNSKASIELAETNFINSTTTELDAFKTTLNTEKDAFITDINGIIDNSQQQITNDVNTKINNLVSDGTLSEIINNELLTDLNNKVAEGEFVVSDIEPVQALLWGEVKGNAAFSYGGETVLLTDI